MSAQRPNLILGLVQRLEWEQLRAFFDSLRQTRFEGEVRLFVAETSKATVRELVSNGVVVQPYRRVRLDLPGVRTLHPYMASIAPLQPLYPRLTAGLSRLSRDHERARTAIAARLTLLTVSRFLLAYVFLRDSGPKWANVMFTDVRDVIFQRDPFDFEIEDAANFFLEEPPTTIGSCHLNTGWLQGSYGDDVATELRDRRISCAGVTIGAYGAVLEYLRLMARELVRMPRQTSGSDSAAHNYLLHHDLVPNARLVENGGPVLTMAKMHDVTVDRLLDPRGEPINAIHQYDRHPHIAEYLLARIAAGEVAGTAGPGATVERFTRDVSRPVA